MSNGKIIRKVIASEEIDTGGTLPSGDLKKEEVKAKKNSLMLSMLPIASLLILIVFFSLGNSAFLSVGNMFNILRQSSILLIVALSSTFIILMSSIDLSFGSIVTLSGAVTVFTLTQYDIGVFPALIIAMVVGVICGLLNGVIFAYGKVPSFLVTLGTMFALDGISLILLKGAPITAANTSFLALSRGTLIGQIPNIALWAFAIYAITIFVAFKTKFGRYMFAIGGGEIVAKMSGVPIYRYKVYGFMVAGVLSGLAGALMASRIGAATPRMGEGLLLDAIAAVIIGGTSLTGGTGGPHKSLLGVLIIAVLGNGMDILSVDPYYQIVIKGIVVILAVFIGLDRSKIAMVK